MDTYTETITLVWPYSAYADPAAALTAPVFISTTTFCHFVTPFKRRNLFPYNFTS